MNHRRILDWYEKEKRELPFRAQRDPYRIWISEIMSQQTRIEAMLPYYERFVKQYPTLSDLALASDDDLMKAWQGLGYYSRARALKKTAQICVEKFGGCLPGTYEELVRLPGIGEYTAGAIASIAFGLRVPAVDGNVIRVYSRYYGLEGDFSKAKEKKALRERVQNDLPAREAMPSWTQALMELGARICMPGRALCAQCPMAEGCVSRTAQDPCRLPLKKKKTPKTVEEKAVVIEAAWSPEGWALKISKRASKGLLAGLYEFSSQLPEIVYDCEDLGEYSHVFSHRVWKMHGHLVLTEMDDAFVPVVQIERNSAIPSAFMPFYRKAVKMLDEKYSENGALRPRRDAAL